MVNSTGFKRVWIVLVSGILLAAACVLYLETPFYRVTPSCIGFTSRDSYSENRVPFPRTALWAARAAWQERGVAFYDCTIDITYNSNTEEWAVSAVKYRGDGVDTIASAVINKRSGQLYHFNFDK